MKDAPIDRELSEFKLKEIDKDKLYAFFKRDGV
jgi:DNA polymerase-1